MYGAILLLATILGQGPATLVPLDAPPPAEITDQRTYELRFRDNRDTVHAFVTPSGDAITYYEDTPWTAYPAQKRTAARRALDGDPAEESPSARKRRLERGFAEAGYVALNGFWTPRELARESERAIEMYAAAQAAREPAPAPAPAEAEATPAAETTAQTPPQPPAPLQRWGLHAAIAAIGLIACVIIAKRFLFE